MGAVSGRLCFLEASCQGRTAAFLYQTLEGAESPHLAVLGLCSGLVATAVCARCFGTTPTAPAAPTTMWPRSRAVFAKARLLEMMPCARHLLSNSSRAHFDFPDSMQRRRSVAQAGTSQAAAVRIFCCNAACFTRAGAW